MDIPPSIIWAIVGFVAVKTFDVLQGIVRERSQLKDDTVKDLDAGLKQNTEALRELRFELKSMAEKVALVPKLEKDIDAAHYRFRELDARLKQ
jgi:ribosomal protein L29